MQEAAADGQRRIIAGSEHNRRWPAAFGRGKTQHGLYIPAPAFDLHICRDNAGVRDAQRHGVAVAIRGAALQEPHGGSSEARLALALVPVRHVCVARRIRPARQASLSLNPHEVCGVAHTVGLVLRADSAGAVQESA